MTCFLFFDFKLHFLRMLFYEYGGNDFSKTIIKLLVHIAPNFQDRYIIPKCTKQHGGGGYVNLKPK